MINNNSYKFLEGGGEMGKLIRSIDWAGTPIGPVDTWPSSLKIATGIILSTPFPMYIAWGKEYIQLYNDGYRPILGSTKHPQAMGISTSETFAEIWHIIEPMFDGVMDGNAVGFPNFMLPLDRNGYVEECYFDFSYSPIRDENGTIGGVLVTVIETTEHLKNLKNLEQSKEELQLQTKALSESEFRFRAMIEQSPVPMLVTKGVDMVFEIINPPMLELMDRDISVINKPWYDALPELKGQPIIDRLYDTFNTGEEWTGFEQPIVLNKGGNETKGYFNITYKPLLENDQIIGVLQSAIDVTEQVVARQQLKDSEENFRLLADNISQLAWMTDESGYIFWYNKRWYDYTGTTFETMKGWGWQEVHHPDHVERVVEKFSRYTQTGEIWEDTFPIRSKEGEYRWFLSRAVPLKDETGKVTRWFGTNTDITEHRNLEQQKDEFISIASHELKTPLTSLKAFMQIMHQNDNPANALKLFASSSLKQLNRLEKLVADLLDVSKISSGKLMYNMSCFDLADLITDTVENIQVTVPKHVFKIKNNPSAIIEADYERLEQVLVNYLNNAVKYAPDSDIVIINAELQPGYIVVSIQDFGIGIEQKHLNNLFDRFFRVDSTAMKYDGLGLGLYVASEIVNRHHGRVWIESEYGQGSTFYFKLPLKSTA